MSRSPNGMGSYKRKKDGRYAWVQTKDGLTREITAKSMPELKAKVDQVAGLPIIKHKLTVSQWFDKWLDVYVKPLKKLPTYDQYKNLYMSHIKPCIGNRMMNSIKPFDLQGIIARMNTAGLSSCTMGHVVKILKLAFGKALKDKIIQESPVVDIEIPVKQAKTRKVLSLDDIDKLFSAMKDSRWIWSIKFALVTGLRRGELLALRWSDINYTDKRVLVQRTVTGDTKSSKEHYAPLSSKAAEYLEKQKECLENEINPCLHGRGDPGLVFPNRKGEMMNPRNYYNIIYSYATQSGIKVSPHSLRHTFVYYMRNSLSLKELQNSLGHSSTTATLDLYGDILSENTLEISNKVDDAFRKIDTRTNIVAFRRAK